MADLSFDLDDLKRLIGQQAIELALLRRELEAAHARYAALLQATTGHAEKDEAAS